MKPPPKKRPGDPILAADWNLLVDALEARTPRPGVGLSLQSSPGGFTYSATPARLAPARHPPFSVIAISRDGESFNVTMMEGWVVERQPRQSDTPAVKFHMPAFGGTGIDSVPRPQLPMAAGDSAWCRILTDPDGRITGTPEIVVAAAEAAGSHHHPADSSGSGGNGDYRIRLFKLEDDGGSPRVKVYQQSDIEHQAHLWSAENLGYGARAYKEHDEATNVHRFRTIRGDHGIGGTETATEIELDFRGENAGGGCPVYMEPAAPDPGAGPARFRSLAGRGSFTTGGEDPGVGEQIAVVCPATGDPPVPGDTVRVLGNGRVGTLTLTKGAEQVVIGWNDGQMVTGGNLAMTIPEIAGGDLNLTIRTISFTLDANGAWTFTGSDPLGHSSLATHHWRNGVYLGTADPGDGLGTDREVTRLAYFPPA